MARRRVILATNIAETSLTIEGVDLVIDSGLEKVAVFSEQVLANKLVQRQVAKSSAIQRAGRAGRVQAGRCIRLYGKDVYDRSPMQLSLPIQQADISPLTLECARWGVNEFRALPLLDLPLASQEQQAWQAMQDITVLDEKRKLSELGERVAQLPCHSRIGKMLVMAKDLENTQKISGLLWLACVIGAILEGKEILKREASAR